MKPILISMLLTTLSFTAQLCQAVVVESNAQQNLKPLIEEAIKRLEKNSRKEWSYLVERFENEEGEVTSSTERYDPAQKSDNKWQLLLLNGSEPTLKQAEEFSEKKRKETEKAKESGLSMKFRDLVQVETLALLSENQDVLIASFDVYMPKLGEKASKRLKGTLTYDKQDKFIQTLNIINTEDFSPLFSANITDFKLDMQFVNIEDAVLPKQFEMAMRGTFAFFTEIDEVSKDTYSDYRFAGR